MNIAPIHILIVEDDLSFGLELEILLEEMGYTTFKRVDHSGMALDYIYSHEPDLILMDININGNLSGLELGNKIAHLDIPVLYITALQDAPYQEASRLTNTIGYLVKPIQPLTLRSAIDLVVYKVNTLKADESNELLTVQEHFITQRYFFFKKKQVYYKAEISDILYVQSDDNYVRVQVKGGEMFILRLPLKKLEELLPAKAFLRTHRRYIVAVDHIEAINFQDSTLLIDKKELPLSQAKRKELEDHIKIIG
jgi:DNA-binding LytR/AlgR family response regulator